VEQEEVVLVVLVETNHQILVVDLVEMELQYLFLEQ